MTADNSDDIQGDNSLGAVGSRPVSDVWKFYTKLYDRRKAMCTICKKDLGGTTNLRNHLSPKHLMFYFLDVENSCDKVQEIVHTRLIC